MKQPIVAVTVSKNYLDGRKWSIKYLNIGKRKNGLPYFHVHITGETDFDKVKLQGIAFQYALKNTIPYILNVRDGTFVTNEQKHILKKYGVAV